MCEEIELHRYDETPWGFRLTGGHDFGIPLTVVRVTGGSLAEEAGMCVGDMIIEINGDSTAQITHSEAQQCILEAGNRIVLSVLRGSPVPAVTPTRGLYTPSIGIDRAASSVGSLTDYESIHYNDTYRNNVGSIAPETHNSGQEMTEEEIAEKLLESAEVIENNGKNVIGVNFKRFVPKCDFIKNSLVFQTLQEEQIFDQKSEEEQLKRCPTKRFSTFLTTPNRPKIKPPEKKKSAELNKTEAKESDDQRAQEEEDIAKIETSCEQVCTNCKCKLTDIEDCVVSTTDNNQIERDENSEEIEAEESEETGGGETDNITTEKYETESIENCEGTLCESKLMETTAADVEVRREPENELEKSILDIQNQLSAIRELPLQIQNHIMLLEKQLSDVLAHKIRSAKTSTPNGDAERAQKHGDVVVDEEQREGDSIEPDEECTGDGSRVTHDDDQWAVDDETVEQQLSETGDDDGPWKINAEEHGERDREPGGRPTYPLTPLPRPIILPGGRKWRGPKDAYNEKFIAETLISQAEVLVGSTLGVNFRKYEPPKFDVSNSAVYKLVHNIETGNNGGIENRPEMVAAEEDFYYHKPIDARQYYLATLPQPTIVPDFENETQYGH